jgi:vacuolar-type H+-ATPase subunit F/Vma7
MKWVLIADEITAVGWRLAGAEVELADARTAGQCFSAARESADLLLITAELAACVPQAELEVALRTQPPLVLVIADFNRRHEPPAVEDEVRHALGVVL